MHHRARPRVSGVFSSVLEIVAAVSLCKTRRGVSELEVQRALVLRQAPPRDRDQVSKLVRHDYGRPIPGLIRMIVE